MRLKGTLCIDADAGLTRGRDSGDPLKVTTLSKNDLIKCG